MGGKEPSRMPGSRAAAILMLAAGLLVPGAAHAAEDGGPSRGLWDRMMETLNLKAEPAQPAPDFVRKTRPESDRLGYIPTATPHKVSPVAVKTAAEIEAEKDALDAAKARQLNPAGQSPVRDAKPKTSAKGRPVPAVAD